MALLLVPWSAAMPRAPAQHHVLEVVAETLPVSRGLREIIDRRLEELGKGGPQSRGDARETLRRVAWRAAIPYLGREIRPVKRGSKVLGAILTLDGIGGEEARVLLARVLFDDQFKAEERLAAALVLAKIGGRAVVRNLADGMRQGSIPDRLRIGLALAAARVPDRHLRRPVGRLASRPVRPTNLWGAVVLALAEMEEPDVAAWVKQIGRSGHPPARRAACLAAAKLADPGTLAMLIDNLKLEKNDPWTSVCALVSIGIRKSDEARSYLTRALKSTEAPIREFAALALGWDRDQRVTQALRHAFANERRAQVRAAVIRALERHHDPKLAARACLDTDPRVRAAALLLTMHMERDRALRLIDQRLTRDTDPSVVNLALSLRLVVASEALPSDHPARREVAVMRVIRQPIWKDLDRYRDEPKAPVWGWIRSIYEHERSRSGPNGVRAYLLNSLVLELLDLVGEFEMPARRFVPSPKAPQNVLTGRTRARASPRFAESDEDLKVWLTRRPLFE